jgi:hypothetical protein
MVPRDDGNPQTSMDARQMTSSGVSVVTTVMLEELQRTTR